MFLSYIKQKLLRRKRYPSVLRMMIRIRNSYWISLNIGLMVMVWCLIAIYLSLKAEETNMFSVYVNIALFFFWIYFIIRNLRTSRNITEKIEKIKKGLNLIEEDLEVLNKLVDDQITSDLSETKYDSNEKSKLSSDLWEGIQDSS